jgi:hypothetical protein
MRAGGNHPWKNEKRPGNDFFTVLFEFDLILRGMQSDRSGGRKSTLFRFRSMRLSISFAGKLLLGLQLAAPEKAEAVAAVAWFIPAARHREGQSIHSALQCLSATLHATAAEIAPCQDTSQGIGSCAFYLCISGSQICAIPQIAGHPHRVLADVASVSLAVFLAHVALLYCFNLTCTNLSASSQLKIL